MNIQYQHTATPWSFKRTASGDWRIQDMHGFIITRTKRFANAEFIVRACNLHDPMYLLMDKLCKAAIDMFEQMRRSNWRDDKGNQINSSVAMMELIHHILDAVELLTETTIEQTND